MSYLLSAVNTWGEAMGDKGGTKEGRISCSFSKFLACSSETLLIRTIMRRIKCSGSSTIRIGTTEPSQHEDTKNFKYVFNFCLLWIISYLHFCM